MHFLLFFTNFPTVRLYREIVLPKTPNTLLLWRRATLKESWNFCFESLTYRATLIVYSKWKWAQPTSLVTEKWESLPLGVLYRPFSCFLHITKGPPSTLLETTFSKIEPKCSYRAQIKCLFQVIAKQIDFASFLLPNHTKNPRYM